MHPPRRLRGARSASLGPRRLTAVAHTRPRAAPAAPNRSAGALRISSRRPSQSGGDRMSVRRTALAALVLAITLVAPAAAAKKPPPPPPPPPPANGGAPTTPTNLHITASSDTSISLAWNALTDSGTWWYCVQKDGSGCFRVDPPTTTFTM